MIVKFISKVGGAIIDKVTGTNIGSAIGLGIDISQEIVNQLQSDSNSQWQLYDCPHCGCQGMIENFVGWEVYSCEECGETLENSDYYFELET